MTREEAIRILGVTKDGLTAVTTVSSYDGALDHDIEALDMAISALREQEERDNPKPLTLEELRQMDGEPVWMETIAGSGAWALVAVDNNVDVRFVNSGTGIWGISLYVSAVYPYGCIAYRSRPKESAQA